MKKGFLNARSPMRLLEQGLHGGLGRGNVGVVVAGHGVGKTSFLVGVALDELLREEAVLHVALGESIAHVRAYYDTLFEELAATSHLENIASVHAEADRKRSIRCYPPDDFDAAKLREAVKLESEAGVAPSLIVIEGLDLAAVGPDEVANMRALAGELDLELWISADADDERIERVPEAVAALGDTVSVILALEPAEGHVGLRALKDHDNPDVENLHVALDPKTLLLTRA